MSGISPPHHGRDRLSGRAARAETDREYRAQHEVNAAWKNDATITTSKPTIPGPPKTSLRPGPKPHLRLSSPTGRPEPWSRPSNRGRSNLMRLDPATAVASPSPIQRRPHVLRWKPAARQAPRHRRLHHDLPWHERRPRPRSRHPAPPRTTEVADGVSLRPPDGSWGSTTPGSSFRVKTGVVSSTLRPHGAKGPTSPPAGVTARPVRSVSTPNITATTHTDSLVRRRPSSVTPACRELIRSRAPRFEGGFPPIDSESSRSSPDGTFDERVDLSDDLRIELTTRGAPTTKASGWIPERSVSSRRLIFNEARRSS